MQIAAGLLAVNMKIAKREKERMVRGGGLSVHPVDERRGDKKGRMGG